MKTAMPESSADQFNQFFTELTAGRNPYYWQRELSGSLACANRLIRIPTGFGKTLGVLAAWVWRRAHQQRADWPRRLVWCLPMRVLVEQTENEVRQALKRLGVLWDEKTAHDGKVGVHLLMGGVDAGQWHLYPECDAVLIGTQDMLLSRAMNRGYASPRARWPMEFGLLNQDALWVMDEVQLMDVGLATSGQLQAFRGEDQVAGKSLRRCCTWWMSATLQRDWLKKSPETKAGLTNELTQNTHCIRPEDRTGNPLWDDVTKELEVVQFSDVKSIAQDVAERHKDRGFGLEGPTLVVLNTVERAIAVWKGLRSNKVLKQAGADIRLMHSRFRPAERKVWRDALLNREACAPGTNRIIITTQVIEAGVDISAPLLVTELAPWTSLVQRFGRCARWGGGGQAIVADLQHVDDKKAAPYLVAELNEALKACNALKDVAPLHLERYEEENEALLPCLYPYEPTHLLLRNELNELFDTTSDLSGADVDISRFIRSGDERDVQVFWRDVVNGGGPKPSMKAAHDELCGVPFLRAREWLCKPGKIDVRAWVWSWLDREWRKAESRDIYPGQTVLVEQEDGGYCRDRGWDPKSTVPVEPVQTGDKSQYESQSCWKRQQSGDGWCPDMVRRPVRALPPEDQADDAEDDESLSVSVGWQTIASHGLQVGQTVKCIAERVGLQRVPVTAAFDVGQTVKRIAPDLADLLHLAGRWHDLGKAHPAFQCSIQADNRPDRDDVAKAPDLAWPCRQSDMYRIHDADQRCGFRHELASVLGLFGVLQRHDSEHQALLGPFRALFDAMEKAQTSTTDAPGDFLGGDGTVKPTAIEQEILNLNAQEFDLLAYLVCAHHGKVRMAWHASPADQKASDSGLRIRGVREGDILPPLELADADGGFHQLPATELDLSPSAIGLSARTGRSWSERVLNLVEHHGPFALAWLESLLRSADMRASQRPMVDKLLQERKNNQSNHSGDKRIGERDMDTATIHPLHLATCYFKTSTPSGILSDRELAPLLAERTARTELAIANRAFAELPLHELLLQLHRHVCADLTPDMAGRWRCRGARFGEHRAPPHAQVPMLMRQYADHLGARLDGEKNNSNQLIEDASSKLLSVHPFENFNECVASLFCIELRYRLDLPEIDSVAS